MFRRAGVEERNTRSAQNRLDLTVHVGSNPTSGTMSRASRRIERRLFAISDRLERLRQEELIVAEELSVHRHLHDDAVRDAAVSEHAEDRAEARETAALVARFEREIKTLRQERRGLESKRAELLAKLEHL